MRLKSYVYRGLFHCAECGCVVTMETQKGHNYHHCTKRVKRDCSQRYVREESVTDQIAELVTSASLPDNVADWMIGEVENDQDKSMAIIETAKGKAAREIGSNTVRRGVCFDCICHK